MSLKVNLLTDDIILQYTENNVLKEYKDINLKVTTKLEPYPKGVYDQDIFGSVFSDRCNCGNMHVSGIRCPRCGSMVLSEVQSFKRFARIELPVLYSGKYKFVKLVQFMKSNFKIVTDFKTEFFKDYSWRDQKVLDICQWKYNKESNTFTLTDTITDFMDCSYEGLLKILSKEFPDKVNEYRSYLNQYILVVPMVLRAPACKFVDGSIKLENNQITVTYQNIIYIVEEYYKSTFQSLKDEINKAIFRGCIRKLISSSVDVMSDLFSSSKDNLARCMQSNNIVNSGRSYVVPDPTLKADEVVIPFHLMYETCKDEFCKFLMKKKNITIKEAEVIYKTQSDLDEIRDYFNEYIEGNSEGEEPKYVLINRAPSLHEMSMFACKVKLTHDYSMKIPQVLCSPTGGDFDGDAYTYFSVPKELNMVVNRSLSARNRFLWKKNHEPLFLPTQEFLQGLIIGTKVDFTKDIQKFEDIQEAEEYRKQTPGFKYQTQCIIGGKQTTLARAILTELFDKDLEAYLGGLKNNITSKNIILLYQQLYDAPDRLDRIQKIQEFAAKLSTLSGATALKISDLYIDIDKKFLDRIKAIENNDKLDDRTKHVAIDEVYKEFQATSLANMNGDVKMMIDTSGRGSSASIIAMATNPMNISASRSINIGQNSLVKGLNPSDYVNHAVENRLLQKIKFMGTPAGGYLTRQFMFLASEYNYSEQSDPDNTGILMRECDAEGRTRLDGTIVKRSSNTENILVRSVVSTSMKPGILTKDMLPDFMKFKEGDRVGMSLISSMTESLTQKMLGLKHGGRLYNLFDDEILLAPDDGKVEVDDEAKVIYFISKNKRYVYPKPDDFVINYNPENYYKKGSKFGCNYRPLTPSYTLDGIIKLTKARAVNIQRYAKNEINISECYAINDGQIRYDRNNKGEIRVFIGSTEYAYSPQCAYFYPEGHQIKKYDRICSGVLDIQAYINKLNDFIELYYYFKKQFLELSNISQELIEFLFVLLINKTSNGLIVKSVVQNIHGSDSFFKSLSFQDAGKTFKKVGYEGVDFVADPVTSVLLNLIINDQID